MSCNRHFWHQDVGSSSMLSSQCQSPEKGEPRISLTSNSNPIFLCSTARLRYFTRMHPSCCCLTTLSVSAASGFHDFIDFLSNCPECRKKSIAVNFLANSFSTEVGSGSTMEVTLIPVHTSSTSCKVQSEHAYHRNPVPLLFRLRKV